MPAEPVTGKRQLVVVHGQQQLGCIYDPILLTHKTAANRLLKERFHVPVEQDRVDCPV